jgi:hypothetical protein
LPNDFDAIRFQAADVLFKDPEMEMKTLNMVSMSAAYLVSILKKVQNFQESTGDIRVRINQLD